MNQEVSPSRKLLRFDISPNLRGEELHQYIQLHEIISSYFPPEEFSDPFLREDKQEYLSENERNPFKKYYHGPRNFSIGSIVWGKTHTTRGISNTVYAVFMEYSVDELFQLPHEKGDKSIRDFVDELSRLESFIMVKEGELPS